MKRNVDTFITMELSIYGIGILMILLWAFFHIPPGVMSYFVALWMAVMFAIPLSYASTYSRVIRLGYRFFWISFAWFIQISRFYYHLSFGVGFVLFAIIWLTDWRKHEKHSSRKKRLMGILAGGIFFLVGLTILVWQIAEVRRMWTFKHLKSAAIERIEFHHDSDKRCHMIEERTMISRIINSFRSTYPYVGRGATFGSDPWTVTLVFNTPAQPSLIFRIGKGIPKNSATIWLTFEEDARDHDYQNVRFYNIATQELAPGLW